MASAANSPVASSVAEDIPAAAQESASARQGVNFWSNRRGSATNAWSAHGSASSTADAPNLATASAPTRRRRRHRRFSSHAPQQGEDGLFACTTPGCTRRYKFGQHRHCCGWCSIGAHTEGCDHAWLKVQMRALRTEVSVCTTIGCRRAAGRNHLHCCTLCVWHKGRQHTTHCQERQTMVWMHNGELDPHVARELAADQASSPHWSPQWKLLRGLAAL